MAGQALPIVMNILSMLMKKKPAQQAPEPEPRAKPNTAMQNGPFEQTFPPPKRLDIDIPITRRT
jgi:hypothetical protein